MKLSRPGMISLTDGEFDNDPSSHSEWAMQTVRPFLPPDHVRTQEDRFTASRCIPFRFSFQD